MISPHDQPEQLSAYFDGELAADDRSRLERHLRTCAECRATLDALTAALVDLRALEDGEPSDIERAAIRRAVDRARSRRARLWRNVGAATSAAAVVAGMAVFAGRPQPEQASDDLAGGGAQRAGPAVLVEERTFDERTVRQLLAEQDAYARAAENKGEMRAELPSAPATRGPAVEALPLQVPDAGGHDGIRRCEEQIFEGNPPPGAPTLYLAASFKPRTSKSAVPAFFLRYEVPREKPARVELWVVRQSDCYILYFAPRTIRAR